MKMKPRLLMLIMLFVLSYGFAKAQYGPENKVLLLFEAGVFPRLGDTKLDDQSFDSNGMGTSLRFTVGYFINPNITVGLGVGNDNFREPVINTFPIFADFRGILSPSESSLFGFYKLGYGFKIGKQYDQGFINNAGIGYQIALGSNFIVPSLGYHRLDFKQKGSFTSNANQTKGTINSLSIMVGYQF